VYDIVINKYKYIKEFSGTASLRCQSYHKIELKFLVY